MPETNEVVDLLKDLMIVQLAAAGVAQADIARVVGASLSRVNPIAKVINKAARNRNS